MGEKVSQEIGTTARIMFGPYLADRSGRLDAGQHRPRDDEGDPPTTIH